MIIEYNPEMMGSLKIFNSFKIMKDKRIKKAMENIDIIKKQIIAAKKKSDEQKTGKKSMLPILMIAGAGIAGIVFFKKKKVKK